MRDSTEWTEDKSTNHAFINHYGSYEASVNMKSNKHLENPTEKGHRDKTSSMRQKQSICPKVRGPNQILMIY